MRFVFRVALCLITIVAVSVLTAFAWDHSERAAAQPAARLGPH
jgi:hypothetical protein